jgi:uncharacterized protein
LAEFEAITEIGGQRVVPYHWSYGESFSEFFEATKERGAILASRCPVCKGVLVPAIHMCGRCYCDVEEFFDVPDEGVLQAFTVVYLPFPGQPTEPPYCYGYITFDGSDTMFPHMIAGVDFEDIRVGMRVKAVWEDADKRKGDLFDIKYFEPS